MSRFGALCSVGVSKPELVTPLFEN